MRRKTSKRERDLLIYTPFALAESIGKNVATIYRWEAAGILPKRRRLASGSVGWLATEIEEWLRDLPAA